jgi:prevent-host-death family protein
VKQFNVHEAKTQFSAILTMVGAGEEIIIAKAGKPIAVLSPYHAPTAEREFGPFKGEFEVPDSFFEPLDEEFMAHFE